MLIWTSKDGFGSKCTLKGDIRIFDFFIQKRVLDENIENPNFSLTTYQILIST